MLGYIVDMATSYYGKLFLVNMGIQWAGWIFATSFKTEKFYDITGKMELLEHKFNMGVLYDKYYKSHNLAKIIVFGDYLHWQYSWKTIPWDCNVLQLQ